MAKLRIALALAMNALGRGNEGGSSGTNSGQSMGLLLALTYP